MSTYPLSPLTQCGLHAEYERVMSDLACSAWTLADHLRHGDAELVAGRERQIVELAERREAITVRDGLDRAARTGS